MDNIIIIFVFFSIVLGIFLFPQIKSKYLFKKFNKERKALFKEYKAASPKDVPNILNEITSLTDKYLSNGMLVDSASLYIPIYVRLYSFYLFQDNEQKTKEMKNQIIDYINCEDDSLNKVANVFEDIDRKSDVRWRQ